MKYDTLRQEFYIEKTDVTTNTTITEEDLAAEYGENFEIALKEASQKVYQFMDNAYAGTKGYQHSLAVRYFVYKSARKQTILMDAINEYIRGDIYAGMGLKAYTNENKRHVPKTVETILRRGNLYIKGEINIILEELEKDWGDKG